MSERGSERRILVVDDEPDVRMALAELLRAHGFAVAVAENALRAIQILECGALPSAVVTDLRMPELVGAELIEYIRDRPQLEHIPVVIVSGRPDLAPRGCIVFTKPVDSRVLVAFLRAAIA